MALRGLRSGGTAHTEASVLAFITDLLKASGVFDKLAGQFNVTAGSGLSVNIAAGRAYLLASGGNGYPAINDATISNQAISSNSSGNPRITAVVLYKDLGASPNSDDSNTTKLMMVDGTPAASPSAPSDATIQAAVGSGNPFIRLANVTVNSGATSPTAIDTTVCPQVAFRSDIINQDAWVSYSPAAGTTLTLDLSKGKKFQINLPNGNVTLALLNVPKNCKSIILRFTQPSSGTGTVTWWSGITWPNNISIVLTNTVNKSDEVAINFLSVTNDSTNTSEAIITGQNM